MASSTVCEVLSSTATIFREDRFLDRTPDNISLMKIGEYVRTPLYEPSIRAMRSSLSDVRKLLEKELKRTQWDKFKLAWKAGRKMYQARHSYLKGKFEGPEEYTIALICWTLDEPYKIYEEFNQLCRQLMTDTWMEFPYKSLLFLLIQAEMRMKYADDRNEVMSTGLGKIQRPITITSGLDYSIEEETEGEENDEKSNNDTCSSDPDPIPAQDKSSSSSSNVVINNPVVSSGSASSLKRNAYKVYRGFEFGINENEFRPRNLVAFSHIMSATMDGQRLREALEEKGRSGKKVTLLEIDQVSWSARYIGSLSVFPGEKEVIIWPWIKFYVVKREMLMENVEKIVLKPTSQSFSGNGTEKEE